MTTFNDFGLAPPIARALADKGYTAPTPIQAQAIPTVMTGRDLLGIAQTGTGKTAAFALPILHRLAADRRPAPKRGCRALILSPTRELATQIGDSFKAYGKHLGMSVAVIFGGVKYGAQIKALAGGLDILVATPGRLIDHLQEKHASLREVEVFVLDEADQMLDLGFLQPIRKIVAGLPKERQNLFFSATMPAEIGKLAGELLKNPAQVSVTPAATTVERIDQRVLFVEADRKRQLLAELFADGEMKRTLVFTRTKRGADRVAKYLEGAGVGAASIHGDKTQGQRERALAAFKAGQVSALVATDIAARGIDIEAVTHVVNFELPNVPDAYVHRIGRTARKGRDGIAISLVADDERGLLKDIQKTTRQTIPSFDRRNDRALGQVAAVERKLEAERKPERRAEPKANVADARDLPPALRKRRNRRRGGGQGGQGQQPQRAQGQGGQKQGSARQGSGQGGGGNQRRGGKPASAGAAPWSPLD